MTENRRRKRVAVEKELDNLESVDAAENTKCKNNPECEDKADKLVDSMTLFDDTLMSMVFSENVEATEVLLRVILGQDDIKIISVQGQKKFYGANAYSRSVQLDILAEDSRHRLMNIEVQRKSSGAKPRRARFHSSTIDTRMLKKGQKFRELPDSYVIFITEKDYYKKGLPIYNVERYIKQVDKPFMDGSNIIYVNGSYKGSDAIGKLMEDFRCKQSKDMNYPQLAKGVKYFKEEEGARKFMSDLVKEYGKKCAREQEIKSIVSTAIEFNISKDDIIRVLQKNAKLSKKKAEAAYKQYA